MKNIIILNAQIESISPLYIGDEDGEMLINEEENKAYLPATSIAGSFRAYLKQNKMNYKALFGNQDKKESSMSKIFISDSYAKVKYIEKRIGVRIDRRTGSNKSGAKIDREYLGKGLIFNLSFEINCADDEKEELKDMLYICLKALNENHIKLGGHKTLGLGNFKLRKVEEREYNLGKVSDLESYFKKETKEMRDITDHIKKYELEDRLVEFIVKGELTTPMLIKAPDTLDSEEADGTNLKFGDKYIIPGSSIKGMLRARIEKIAQYFDKEQVAEKVFGSESYKRASRIIVDEAEINDEGYNNNISYNRIKIDRFTSGTMNSALMNEKPIMGKTEFKVIYKRSEDNELDIFTIGILALALRDLATENLTIGSGESIGRGKFKGHEMIIIDNKNRIEINFSSKEIKGKEIMNQYISSVSNYRIS